jgi:xanthine dehydrogenase accessory factor
MSPADPITVLFFGCGDLGTGAAHRLVGAGYRVAIVELERPLAVRRAAAFAEAARTGEVEVEGVRCRRVELADLQFGVWPQDAVPLVVAPIASVLSALRPRVVVDARLTKRPIEEILPAGTLRIALGPGHVAGRDCDAAIETWRGPDLGRVFWQGSATADTGQPGEVGGSTWQRVLRAPRAGIWRSSRGLGDRVALGDTVGAVDGEPVRSLLSGRIRGLLATGDPVESGQKLGDVDPRPDAPDPQRISDKSQRIGAGVLEAVRRGLELDPSEPSGRPS